MAYLKLLPVVFFVSGVLTYFICTKEFKLWLPVMCHPCISLITVHCLVSVSLDRYELMVSQSIHWIHCCFHPLLCTRYFFMVILCSVSRNFSRFCICWFPKYNVIWPALRNGCNVIGNDYPLAASLSHQLCRAISAFAVSSSSFVSICPFCHINILWKRKVMPSTMN